MNYEKNICPDEYTTNEGRRLFFRGSFPDQGQLVSDRQPYYKL